MDALRARVERGKQAIENVVSRLSPDDTLSTQSEEPPASDDTPTPTGSPVSGEAVGPGGDAKKVEGDIELDGSFTVTGDGVETAGATGEDGRNVTGTFDWGEDSGAMTGQVTGGEPPPTCTACLCAVSRPVGATRSMRFRWNDPPHPCRRARCGRPSNHPHRPRAERGRTRHGLAWTEKQQRGLPWAKTLCFFIRPCRRRAVRQRRPSLVL